VDTGLNFYSNSVSKMTYIVSGGQLHSTHSLIFTQIFDSFFFVSWNFCRCAISPQHHSIQTIRRLNAAAGLAFCWCFVNINVILPVAEDAHVLLSPLVVVDSRRKAMSLSSSFCICGSTVHVRIIWCKCDWCLNCKLTENFNCRNLLTNLHRLRV